MRRLGKRPVRGAQLQGLERHSILLDGDCDPEVGSASARESLTQATGAGKKVNYGNSHAWGRLLWNFGRLLQGSAQGKSFESYQAAA